MEADWAWNRIYQDLYNRAKEIIKTVLCMKFYDTSRPQYLETDALGVSLGARSLPVSNGINCGQEKYQTMQIYAQLLLSAKVY